MGILFAAMALVSWGVGDFLIERSTRKFGDVISLFFITAFASIVLLPWAYPHLIQLLQHASFQVWGLLAIASIVLLGASVFNFEALRIGKLSVMEPIFTLEILVTAALGIWFIGERPGQMELILILAIMAGIFLVSLKSLAHIREMAVERGTWYAVIGTIFMGIVNFMFGVTSRLTDPLFVNWFTSVTLMVVVLLFLLFSGRTREIVRDFRKSPRLALGVSFVDNLAWVAYSYSVLYIPIAIAISISESYIALAALLGLLWNRERLKAHQIIGLMIAVFGAISLSIIA